MSPLPSQEKIEPKEKDMTEEEKFRKDEDLKNELATAQQQDESDKKLLDYLEVEYGGDEDNIPFDEEEDLGPRGIDSDGWYYGFVTDLNITPITRQNATKTKPAGSKYFWLKPTIKTVKKKGENGKTEPAGGYVWPSWMYEPGNMGDYFKYCVATKCIANIVNGKKKFYPKAPYTQGGSVGMPIAFQIEMDTRERLRKDEETEQWVKVIDEDGSVIKDRYPKVLTIAPWDTTERWTEEKEQQSNQADLDKFNEDGLPF